jgi:hypothetical protein
MDTEKFEESCISYLYNEMSDEQRREFQQLLASDRESNIKFNAIRRAQAIISKLPKADPPGTISTDSIRAEHSVQPATGRNQDDPEKPELQRTGPDQPVRGKTGRTASDSATATDHTISDSATGKSAVSDHASRDHSPTGRPADVPAAETPPAGARPATHKKGADSTDQKNPQLRILPVGVWSRAISAAAAVLFAILIFGAVSGLQIRWDDSGFAMSMSLFGERGTTDTTPPAPTYLLQDETLEQLRKQQEELFSEIMAAEREQQRIMLLETLSEYAEAIETRRMIDMQLIGLELADFQQQTNQQLSQTDRIIYQLIETLSYNQELQDEQ